MTYTPYNTHYYRRHTHTGAHTTVDSPQNRLLVTAMDKTCTTHHDHRPAPYRPPIKQPLPHPLPYPLHTPTPPPFSNPSPPVPRQHTDPCKQLIIAHHMPTPTTQPSGQNRCAKRSPYKIHPFNIMTKGFGGRDCVQSLYSTKHCIKELFLTFY